MPTDYGADHFTRNEHFERRIWRRFRVILMLALLLLLNMISEAIGVGHILVKESSMIGHSTDAPALGRYVIGYAHIVTGIEISVTI